MISRDTLNNMRIVAIYKAFRGEEFFVPSIESIYDVCDKVIVVLCERSWNGDGENTCKKVMEDWVRINDGQKKIIVKTYSGKCQTEAYNIGWDIANKYDHDWKLLIDTDEVWDKKELSKLIDIARLSRADGIRCNMHEYIKSPLFRITPTPPLKPFVLIRNGVSYSPVRCSDVLKHEISDTYFHHFTLVRSSLSEVIKKQANSCDVEGVSSVDWDIWIKTVWNKLPNAYNIKPLVGFEHAWKTICVISPSDLPETMQKSVLVKRFCAYNFENKYGGGGGVSEKSFEKYRLPKDFGPGHERWGVPSVMQRYHRMMSEA